MEPVARAFEAIEMARTLDARDRLEVMYVVTLGAHTNVWVCPGRQTERCVAQGGLKPSAPNCGPSVSLVDFARGL